MEPQTVIERLPSLLFPAMGGKKVNWVDIGVLHAGGATRLASALGVERQTIHKWIARGNIAHLSVERAIEVARLTRIDLGLLCGIAGLHYDEREAEEARAGHKATARSAHERKKKPEPGGQSGPAHGRGPATDGEPA